MNAVSGIFVAVALIFGGGYALDRNHDAVKTNAVQRVQKGTPSLSAYTNKLTCASFSNSGAYGERKCRKTKLKP